VRRLTHRLSRSAAPGTVPWESAAEGDVVLLALTREQEAAPS
jgi:hypothetical protein